MKSVYFVRHGQTVWNVENKICGATDIELTALGHEQAIETGKKILEKKIEADVILYSPLVRAKDTALHISEITGIPAKEEMRLKEQNFGKYESTAASKASRLVSDDWSVSLLTTTESTAQTRRLNRSQTVTKLLLSVPAQVVLPLPVIWLN